MVKEQVSDNPLHVICEESNDKGRVRSLHRNLLLSVNDLPVEIPSQPVKSLSKASQRQQNTQVRVRDKRDQTMVTGFSDDASEI